jgi:hypothetical protein
MQSTSLYVQVRRELALQRCPNSSCIKQNDVDANLADLLHSMNIGTQWMDDVCMDVSYRELYTSSPFCMILIRCQFFSFMEQEQCKSVSCPRCYISAVRRNRHSHDAHTPSDTLSQCSNLFFFFFLMAWPIQLTPLFSLIPSAIIVQTDRKLSLVLFERRANRLRHASGFLRAAPARQLRHHGRRLLGRDQHASRGVLGLSPRTSHLRKGLH